MTQYEFIYTHIGPGVTRFELVYSHWPGVTRTEYLYSRWTLCYKAWVGMLTLAWRCKDRVFIPTLDLTLQGLSCYTHVGLPLWGLSLYTHVGPGVTRFELLYSRWPDVTRTEYLYSRWTCQYKDWGVILTLAWRCKDWVFILTMDLKLQGLSCYILMLALHYED